MLTFLGKILNREVMYDWFVKGITVTVVSKGPLNGNILLHWIFYIILSSNKIDVRSIFDGCHSHYNGDIINKAIGMRFILVLLQENFDRIF